MLVSLFSSTLTLALAVAAFEPRQDLSNPAVASSVYTALSSNGPVSLSSFTSSLDAGFSTETGPISSIATLPPSATPVNASLSETTTSSVSVSMGIIPGTSALATDSPTSTPQSGAKRMHFALDGLAVAAAGLVISILMIL